MKILVPFALLAGLAACAAISPETGPEIGAPVPPPPEMAETEPRPKARPGALDTTAPPAPPPAARTAEQFDTTTPEQRAAAAAAPPVEDAPLGTTIASLGDPAKPGFWLETPLVKTARAGRVSYQGKSAAVTLEPIAGQSSAGSRISLAAMRLIGAPLTSLPEVAVFAE